MSLLTLAQIPKYGKELRTQKNSHEMWVRFYACARTPHERALVIALGIVAWPNLPKPNLPELALAEKLLNQLKVVHTPIKIKTTNYSPAIPSDAARHQNKLWRDEHGFTYHPPRSVGVRLARRGVERRIVSAGQAQLIRT